MTDFLHREIKFLPGVGPKRAELLQQELSVFTYEDMLYYFPYKYVDRSKFYKIRELRGDEYSVQIKGKILRFETAGDRGKKRLIGIFTDGVATVELVWFSGHKYVLNRLKTDVEYVIFGKPTVFNGKLNFTHPEVEVFEKVAAGIQSHFQPFYSTTEKMKANFLTSRVLQQIIEHIFKQPGFLIQESLPLYILEQYRIMPLGESVFNIHFPQSEEKLKKARFRVKFEELFLIQLNQLRQKSERERNIRGFVFEKVGEAFNGFYHNKLPFTLTEAQKRVMREIRRDVGSGRQMNRLLQGDVGSGKTMVALMAMLLAIDNGFQACLMAPTEILATQHFNGLKELVEDMGVTIALLTGSTKKSERTRIHEGLQSGSLQLLIGTHALVEEVVQFKNLGLAIVDEQHKFGVVQRAKLRTKNVVPPHVLVMTATPIPRTLAMTIYGDLDVSVIDELPPGRKPIQTMHYTDSRRLPMHALLRKHLDAGRQVYVVFPLIKESEKFDYKALEDGYVGYSQVFPPPQYSIVCVHGKMKPVEKDKSMQLFVSGKVKIMVATTVIEVGVNVPNASVMVIESAEKFGLSQLHQLRGRVGRGSEKSICILMTPDSIGNDARKRMGIMLGSTDGFKIAEEDLKMRGPGDLEGTQQSGTPMSLKMANLATDGPIVEFARRTANDVINDDPLLEYSKNTLLRIALQHVAQTTFDFSKIS
jgi:ATP-dependent DNA helicase RecG